MAAWIREWLHNRKQKVMLNGEHSKLQDVLSGVPQGSVLGPTLFLIFLNGIDTTISSHVQKLADDRKVYLSVPSEVEIATLQQDISNLCQWTKDRQMVFNALQSVTEETDIDVIISNDLKPSKQCVSAIKKANDIINY